MRHHVLRGEDRVSVTQRMRVSRLMGFTAVFTCTLVLATAGAAYGFWTTLGSGSGQAQAITLGTPGAGSVTSPTSTSLTINWGAASGLPTGAGYIVLRSPSGTAGTFTAVSAGSCNQSTTGGSSAVSCVDNDPSLTSGTTYFYEVEASYVPGTLLLWSSPTNGVFSGTTLAADGSGTLTTPTTSVNASSTGNTIVFTYKAPVGGISGGTVTVAVPTGWTAPVTTNAVGCTTASTGTLSTSGQLITVSGLILAANGTLTITYGATSGGACTGSDGATATSTAGAQTWQGQEKSTSGGTLTNIVPSPSITVKTPVSVSVLAQGTSSPITNVSTVNGRTELILVYTDGSSNTPTASVTTGAGTPFSSSPAESTLFTQGVATTGNPKDHLILITATGNGASGTVTVTTSNGTLKFFDVLQLSSGATVQGTPQGNPAPSTDTNSSTATALLNSPAFSEIALIGLSGGSGSTTISPPSEMSLLGSYQSGAVGNVGMYFDSTAQSSAAFGLSASRLWGTIAVEVG